LDSFKRILQLIKPYLGRFIFAMSLTFVFVGTFIAGPYVSKFLVDEVIKGGKINYLVGVLVLLVCLSMSRAIGAFFRGIMFERISQNIIFDFRQRLYDHLHELPFRFYDNHRIGEIMSRMTGDMEAVRMLLVSAVSLVAFAECATTVDETSASDNFVPFAIRPRSSLHSGCQTFQ
jgi:ATP-binding cassette subfamily B protein